MKQHVLAGITDYTVLVLVRDDAGAPATGLAHTDIDIAYARVETDNDVITSDVAPADLANLTAAHSDWGWEEVSATDHPGLYRLDIADAVFASGAWSAVVSVTGTGLDPCQVEFVLVAYNQHDGVRLGLTALPNAAAEAAGGLYTRGTGAGQINQPANGMVDVNAVRHLGTAYATPTTAGVPEVDVTFVAGVAASSTIDPAVLVSTTIATLASQTSFTLTDGSADNDAYNRCLVVVIDASTAVQKCVGYVLDYTGSTKTVTLEADPGVFTMAVGDTVHVVVPSGLSEAGTARGVWNALRASYATAGTFGGGVLVNSVTNDAISAGSFLPGAITADAVSSTYLAAVQSEANDALVANRLDELLAADSDIDGAAPPAVGSVFHELMTKTAGSFTYDQTTDSLEAVRDRGDAAWVTATGFSTHSAADVWAVGTRALTILDEDATTLDLDATIRAAVGLASANLDTQLGDLPTAAENAAAVLAAGDVDGYSLEETLKLCLAALAGKLSGAATTTITIRAADDSKDRITATVDSNGNRSSVTLDETG